LASPLFQASKVAHEGYKDQTQNSISQLRDYNFKPKLIQDDPKLLGDSGEAPIFEWIDWRFDSRCEIFSLLEN
jgi:transposase